MALSHSYHPDNLIPSGNWIWVFVCAPGRRRWHGNAKIALKHFGASRQHPYGRHQSAYAMAIIEDAAGGVSSLGLELMCSEFISHALSNPQAHFFVTDIRQELKSINLATIARCFAECPPNVSLPLAWKDSILEARQMALTLC